MPFPPDEPTEGPFYRCGACGDEYDGKQNDEHPGCPVKEAVDALNTARKCEHDTAMTLPGEDAQGDLYRWCPACGALQADFDDGKGFAWHAPTTTE